MILNCDVTQLLLLCPSRTRKEHSLCRSINTKQCSVHVQYACIHSAAGHPVRIVQLTSMIGIVDYEIGVNGIKDMQYMLKTVIPVLKRFVTLTLEHSYAPIVTMIN